MSGENFMYCDVCDCRLPICNIEHHTSGKKHMSKIETPNSDLEKKPTREIDLYLGNITPQLLNQTNLTR